MKKGLLFAIALIASVSMFAQSQVQPVKLKNGLGEESEYKIKILGKNLDSAFGAKLSKVIETSVTIASINLKYSMKDPYSFKVLPVEDNSIMYFRGGVVVTLVTEGKNGYGNPITKRYTSVIKGNFDSENLYKDLGVTSVF